MASITGTCNTLPSSAYQPLPTCEYTLEIVESEYVPNANGDGMVLNCKTQVMEGKHTGRPFYINYSLEHADPQAQEIGQRDFAALRRATGVLNPQDTEELHFKAFRVKIGVQERTGANVIKEYLFDDAAMLLGAAA